MQRDSRGATREQVAIATRISAEGGFAGGIARIGIVKWRSRSKRVKGVRRSGLLSLVPGRNLETVT